MIHERLRRDASLLARLQHRGTLTSSDIHPVLSPWLLLPLSLSHTTRFAHLIQENLQPRVIEAYRNENFDKKVLSEMVGLVVKVTESAGAALEWRTPTEIPLCDPHPGRARSARPHD